ncbi:MAG: replication restart helicase PriA [Thermoanaerobaculaceae bacterium]
MFAQVLLPLAVPEPLTYLVPEELEGAARPGVRVRVPLRGKTRVGLILELSQETEVPVEKVLPILGVLDLAPMVPPYILEMIRFVADYYWCPAGLVAKACLPPKVLQQRPESVELGPRAVELLPELSGEARRLVEILLEKKRTLLSSLCSLGFSRDKLFKLLPELQNRQILRLRQPEPPWEAGRMVSALAVVEGREEALLSDKQRRLLEALQARGGWALEAEVASDLGFSRAVADALVKKGLLRRFYQLQKPTIRRWELPPSPPPLRLSPAQEQALGVLERALGEKKFQAFLLLGVTGSGKTEVYLRTCEKVVAGGGQALILVPEIGLTPKLAGELSARFGSRVAVMHSSLPAGERFALWERVRRGEVDVVAGPRSALWAPLPQLKLVVVDEEQDPSYKQGEEPRYNARDLALVLGKQLQIPVVLASATPSLETFWLCLQGKVQLLELPERVAGLRLPEVEIVSLASAPPEPGEHGHRWFSPRLVELLQETLARGEQAILLLNRRGWAPVMLCRDCGYQLACNNCAIPLTLHRRPEALVCHYCGFTMFPPPLCPRCGGGLLVDVGAGTEKVAELLKRHVPNATVGILDRDTAHTPARLLATLADFSSGRIQVLVGTQMVSKGHHFPKVTLTAVINADNLLGFPDFRGAEKTWQLLVQVAGRAGRGERPGRVVVQTYHPEHHAVQAAATQDVEGFLQKELTFRRAFRYPPVHRMVLVRFEAAKESPALRAAEAAFRQLPSLPGLRVLGPTPSPIPRLRGRYRVQMLFLGSSRQLVREALQAACKGKLPAGVRRIVDVDPVSTI